MPELPEVEVVRRGLEDWVVGRTVESVQVVDPRSVRRHLGGPADFTASLTRTSIGAAVRRGKFLWLLLDGLPRPSALVAHLGMSGQLLVEEPAAPDEKHLKVRLELSPEANKPNQLRFIDQRIFGGMFLSPLVPTGDQFPGGQGSEAPWIPEAAAHIARDVLDPASTPEALYQALRKKNTQISSVQSSTSRSFPVSGTSTRTKGFGPLSCTVCAPPPRSADPTSYAFTLHSWTSWAVPWMPAERVSTRFMSTLTALPATLTGH